MILFRWFVLFVRCAWGCVHRPYVTYRTLASRTADAGHVAYIFLLIAAYFAFAGLIRVGLRNPFLLTVQWNVLFGTTLATYVFFAVLFLLLGGVSDTLGRFRTVLVLWAYAFLPTLVWFFTTSVLFLFLPPPRTSSIGGTLYSVGYIAFSLAVLVWKVILYYLTLRFGLRMDFFRIMFVSSCVIPVVFAYSIFMYRMGIFRIPFL